MLVSKNNKRVSEEWDVEAIKYRANNGYWVLVLAWGHKDLGSTKMVVQKELNRVLYWILLGTYTNIGWSVHLSPVIT